MVGRVPVRATPSELNGGCDVTVARQTSTVGTGAVARPEMYVLYRQFDAQPWFTPRDLAVRATDEPTRLVSAITREIRAVDAALPVSNVAQMNDLLDEDVAARRIGTIVLIAFAAFAVLLAIATTVTFSSVPGAPPRGAPPAKTQARDERAVGLIGSCRPPNRV